MFADESFLNRLIDNQRAAVRYYRLFGLAVFALGAAVVVLALAWPEQSVGERIKILLTIGGGVISSLSTFQLKEILSRRDRIAVLEMMKTQVLALGADEAKADERRRVEEFLAKLVEKIMG